MFLMLLGMTLYAFQGSFVRAADDDEKDGKPEWHHETKKDPSEGLTKEEAAELGADNRDDSIKDFTKEELNRSTTPLISITSIDPEQGPVTGK